MSRISISLIISSIVIVTLCQYLIQHATVVKSFSAGEIFIVFYLFHCATKLSISWLKTPVERNLEDKNKDQQN